MKRDFKSESGNFLKIEFVMSNWIIVILCAVAAVALFVAGMSLTLMLKGHHIDSEISTNKEMQRRGIKCAVQETREAMQSRPTAPTRRVSARATAPAATWSTNRNNGPLARRDSAPPKPRNGLSVLPESFCSRTRMRPAAKIGDF